MRLTAGTRVAVAGSLSMIALAGSAQAAPTTAPANVHVTTTTATQLSLAWDAPSEGGITSAVLRASARRSTYEFDFRSTTSASLTSGDIGSLTCGTTYDVTIAWSDGASAGPRASLQAATSPCTKPTAAAPSGVTAAAVDAGSIRFTWDDSADSAAFATAYSVVGPLQSDTIPPFLKTARTTTLDAERLVCGETYTFNVGWVNDEGGLSPLSQIPAKTEDCSTLGAPRPGPTAVQITSPSLTGYTLKWQGKPSDIIGYRMSAVGPNVDTSRYSDTLYASDETYGRIPFTAACGETYTVSISWVYSDGGISLPTSASGPAPACPPPPKEIAAPPIVTDTTAPVVTVAKKRLRVNKKGALTFSLACGAGEKHCSGTLTLRAGKNGKRIRLPAVCGKGSFRIAGGANRTLTIRLRRSVLVALKKAGSVRLVLVIAARDDSGNEASSTVPVRALAPPSKISSGPKRGPG